MDPDRADQRTLSECPYHQKCAVIDTSLQLVRPRSIILKFSLIMFLSIAQKLKSVCSIINYAHIFLNVPTNFITLIGQTGLFTLWDSYC